MKSRNRSFPWILGLTLGIIVSGIPIIFAPVYEMIPLFPYWFGGLFITCFAMGITFPTQVWRWAIAVGLGLPIVVILMIIIDSIFDLRSHNLFPIEIVIAFFIAVISSFPGVYLVVLVGRKIEKSKMTEDI